MSAYRSALAALSGVILACAATPLLAQTVLSDADRATYTSAFDQLRRGQLDAARETARRAEDRVLLGQIEFERLFHDNHVSTFEELSAWLEDYADLPDAPRAYSLAMRRRPDGAPEPREPVHSTDRSWESVRAAAPDSEVPAGKEARVLYNNDQLQQAYDMGLALAITGWPGWPPGG